MRPLEEVREYFSEDKYATATTGIVIEEASEGYARVSLKLDERHKNAMGAVMGAVYFTMADFAFAVATNASEAEASTVTLDSSVRFVSSPRTDTLFAEAKVVKDGKSVSFCEIKVTDESGRDVCLVSSTGYKVK
ncbi:MAG: PaaI family thioesterase [Eubacterium sp.]|nr:PaaI family thioesterase [Eubacterium sp.]